MGADHMTPEQMLKTAEDILTRPSGAGFLAAAVAAVWTFLAIAKKHIEDQT